MTRALMSICPLSTPCRAHVGSAWCRLCQDSPNEGIASHHTFRARSRVLKSSLPNTWQIELIENVMCSPANTRMSPAQNSAVRAPCQENVSSAPRPIGTRNVESTIIA